MDLPLIQNEEARRAGRYKLTFDSSLPSRFGVIPRRGAPGDIRWFEAKPCYIYHVVNAGRGRRDRPRRLPRVPTRTGHRRADPPREAAGLPQTRCPHAPVRFDLVSGRTSESRVDDDNTEFPRSTFARWLSDPLRVQRAHRDAETNLFDGLVRYDNLTDERQSYFFGPGRYGSESPLPERRLDGRG